MYVWPPFFCRQSTSMQTIHTHTAQDWDNARKSGLHDTYCGKY